MKDNPLNKRKWYKQLYCQVVIGVLLGALLGFFFPDLATQMKPLGDGFVKLIRMMVIPIVFTTVVLGITKMDNAAALHSSCFASHVKGSRGGKRGRLYCASCDPVEYAYVAG